MASVSIVFPTLNAAAALRRSLPALANFAGLDLIHEVIVADGRSADETGEIAGAAGGNYIQAESGCGAHLAAGAEAVRGDWLLFLHADTVLQPGWGKAVCDFIGDGDNLRPAGYCRFALYDGRPGARRGQ